MNDSNESQIPAFQLYSWLTDFNISLAYLLLAITLALCTIRFRFWQNACFQTAILRQMDGVTVGASALVTGQTLNPEYWIIGYKHTTIGSIIEVMWMLVLPFFSMFTIYLLILVTFFTHELNFISLVAIVFVYGMYATRMKASDFLMPCSLPEAKFVCLSPEFKTQAWKSEDYSRGETLVPVHEIHQSNFPSGSFNHPFLSHLIVSGHGFSTGARSCSMSHKSAATLQTPTKLEPEDFGMTSWKYFDYKGNRFGWCGVNQRFYLVNWRAERRHIDEALEKLHGTMLPGITDQQLLYGSLDRAAEDPPNTTWTPYLALLGVGPIRSYSLLGAVLYFHVCVLQFSLMNFLPFLWLGIIHFLLYICVVWFKNWCFKNPFIKNDEHIHVWNPGELKSTPISQVVLGDLVSIRQGDQVPGYMLILSGTCSVDERSSRGFPMFTEKTAIEHEEDLPLNFVNGTDNFDQFSHEHLIMPASRIVAGNAVAVFVGYSKNPVKFHFAQLSWPSILKFILNVIIAMIGVVYAIVYVPNGINWNPPILLLLFLVIPFIPIASILISLWNILLYFWLRSSVLLRSPHRLFACRHAEICMLDKTGTMTNGDFRLSFVRPAFSVRGKKPIFSNARMQDVKQPVDKRQMMFSRSTVTVPPEVSAAWAIVLASSRDDSKFGTVLSDSARFFYVDSNVISVGENPYRILKQYPFDHELRYSGVVAQSVSGKPVAYFKGCVRALSPFLARKSIPEEFDENVQVYLTQSYYLLAVGYIELEAFDYHLPLSEILKPNGLTFLGCLGLTEDIDPDVFKLLDEFKKLSLRPIMCSGDHLLSCLSVANQSGMIHLSEESVLHDTGYLREIDDNMSMSMTQHTLNPTTSHMFNNPMLNYAHSISSDDKAAETPLVMRQNLVIGVVDKQNPYEEDIVFWKDAVSGHRIPPQSVYLKDNVQVALSESAFLRLLTSKKIDALVPKIVILSEMSPTSKSLAVELFKEQGSEFEQECVVMYIGDGVNDKLALAQAHIPIARKKFTGSEDVPFHLERLSGVLDLLKVGKFYPMVHTLCLILHTLSVCIQCRVNYLYMVSFPIF